MLAWASLMVRTMSKRSSPASKSSEEQVSKYEEKLSGLQMNEVSANFVAATKVHGVVCEEKLQEPWRCATISIDLLYILISVINGNIPLKRPGLDKSNALRKRNAP